MAIFYKNSAGQFFRTASGQYFTKVESKPFITTYNLLYGSDNVVVLPNGAELLINYGCSSQNADFLSFSADFDLVVCTEHDQWGTYELYGDSTLSEPIYIYDHNGYENGLIMGSYDIPPREVLRQYYSPIAILYFDTATGVLTVTKNGV